MESIANITKIAELKAELAGLVTAKRQLPRLTLEDREDCSDNHQAHIELNYEIEGLEAEIKALERQNGD